MFCCHSIINSRYLEAKEKPLKKQYYRLLGATHFMYMICWICLAFVTLAFSEKEKITTLWIIQSQTDRRTSNITCIVEFIDSFEMWKKHAYREKKVNNEMEYNAIILLDSISYEATAAFNWATSISLRMCIYCVWTHLYNSWWHWTSAIEIWEHPNKKMHLI